MSALSLLHQTPNRVRYSCAKLKGEYNTRQLEQALKNALQIEVRVNSRIGSIVFEGENLDIEAVENSLNTLDISTYQTCSAFLSECYSASEDEKPSKAGIFRAASALAMQPLIPSTSGKMLVSATASMPLLIKGTKELFTEGLTSKVLEATAVGVSLAREDFTAANSTNTMLEIGEYIEETMVHRSDDLVKELAKPNIAEAWIEVKEGDGLVEKRISTSEIKIGDIVVVGAGDSIPIDGHVIDGTASVNQVSMTGEAAAVKKERGDRVISGTVIESGRIRIWAEQVGDDTATSHIKRYIKSALDEKSAIGLKATRLADRLVPVTLGLAGLSYLIRRDMASVAAVLQADYSCALKLATPVAFKNALSVAGRNGILIKGSKALEALASVDTFVFDKTGTLTHGDLKVVSIQSFDEKWSENDILNLTASAEEHYFHPIAEAVVKAAQERGFVHKHHDEVEFIVAHGVKTLVDGKMAIIGSRHFLEVDEKISFKGHEDKIKTCLDGGKILLYVAYDGKLLGTIGMMDRVRENTKSSLEALRQLGAKELIMLTGDVKEKALVLAKEVGIDTVYANLLPTEKAKIVKQLKDSGKKVAFIGDGINDAPALMSANVGFSMYKGADIAKATADISLLKDDISAVVEAKRVANKTMSRIDNNFNATVGINSAILLGAAAGIFSPVTTAVLHNGTTIGLLFSSMQNIKTK